MPGDPGKKTQGTYRGFGLVQTRKPPAAAAAAAPLVALALGTRHCGLFSLLDGGDVAGQRGYCVSLRIAISGDFIASLLSIRHLCVCASCVVFS